MSWRAPAGHDMFFVMGDEVVRGWPARTMRHAERYRRQGSRPSHDHRGGRMPSIAASGSRALAQADPAAAFRGPGACVLARRWRTPRAPTREVRCTAVARRQGAPGRPSAQPPWPNLMRQELGRPPQALAVLTQAKPHEALGMRPRQNQGTRRGGRTRMRHQAHRQAPAPHPAAPREATVRHAAQQAEPNANAEGMHAKDANGPGAGAALRSRHGTTEPRPPAPVRQPLSHSRVLRASACISVKPCLLRREPLDAAGQRAHLAAHRQEPHAPIQAAIPLPELAAWRQNPMHQKQLPERRCPPSRPECRETIAELAGIGRVVI